MSIKFKNLLRTLSLLVLLTSLIPLDQAVLAASMLPPADMFQLPWEQGQAWVAIDGIDNASKRLPGSPHNYLNGGAIDFAPHNNMIRGENTANFWVAAAADGKIVELSKCHMKIAHANGWVSEYQHLANLQVKLGDVVVRNQRLAVIANALSQPVCPGSEPPDIPHLHFVLRPTMLGVSLTGWEVRYSAFWNSTTFKKNSKTVGLYKPLLNVFDSQPTPTPTIPPTATPGGQITATPIGGLPTNTPDPLATATSINQLTNTPDPFATATQIGQSTNTPDPFATATQIGQSTDTPDPFVTATPDSQSTSTPDPFATFTPTPAGPYVTTTVNLPGVNLGESALASVSLHNVPGEGYTSAEFICTYNAILVEASNIAITDLFGADAVTAINGPQNGSFIVAIAGSHGNKALTSGVVFTFNVKGLQAGQTAIECKARVSKGDNVLTDLPSSGAVLSIYEAFLTPTPVDASTATSFPTFIPSETFTPLPPTTGSLTGQALASKAVTISVYDLNNTLIATVSANVDGTFNFIDIPSGTYTVLATASGFLSAQGSVSISGGNITTLPAVNLLAGDIDNNNVIDQFDALTIGMSYNTATPAAADLNNDGIINVIDLELLAGHYRTTGPVVWQ